MTITVKLEGRGTKLASAKLQSIKKKLCCLVPFSIKGHGIQTFLSLQSYHTINIAMTTPHR
jgi:hypothetical protein